MARTWVFQYKRDVAKRGGGASWYVGHYTPEGKRKAESCGPGSRGKRLAERKARQIEAELLTGTYQAKTKATWGWFREKYRDTVLAGMPSANREQAEIALSHFERIVSPRKLVNIKTETINRYVARRRHEPGRNPGSTVSPATINKELRYIKAALRTAQDWELIPKVPKFKMERVPEKLPCYVTPEHFHCLYHEAAPLAELPRNPGQHYTPADWWRALLAFLYMTGWRIGATMALRWEDVDLDKGVVQSRWQDNKGSRDVLVPLHPAVVSLLRRLAGFHPLVFRWCHNDKKLWREFSRIQVEAGIRLPCREDHRHTDGCRTYGFHDLRRGFASMNAERMTPDALQALMQHRTYTTTQKYINMAQQLNRAVDDLYVPDALRVVDAG